MKKWLFCILIIILANAMVFTPAVAELTFEEMKKFTYDDIKKLRVMAEQGDADAQYKLADFYSEGIGVTKNQRTAFRLYRKAAIQGHVEAQQQLAFLYSLGEGVAPDRWEAYVWALIARAYGADDPFITSNYLGDMLGLSQSEIRSADKEVNRRLEVIDNLIEEIDSNIEESAESP